MAEDLVESRRVIEGQDDRVLPGSFCKSWALGYCRGILRRSILLDIQAWSAEADSQ
jgi:hypothetical protein